MYQLLETKMNLIEELWKHQTIYDGYFIEDNESLIEIQRMLKEYDDVFIINGKTFNRVENDNNLLSFYADNILIYQTIMDCVYILVIPFDIIAEKEHYLETNQIEYQQTLSLYNKLTDLMKSGAVVKLCIDHSTDEYQHYMEFSITKISHHINEIRYEDDDMYDSYNDQILDAFILTPQEFLKLTLKIFTLTETIN